MLVRTVGCGGGVRGDGADVDGGAGGAVAAQIGAGRGPPPAPRLRAELLVQPRDHAPLHQGVALRAPRHGGHAPQPLQRHRPAARRRRHGELRVTSTTP
eukprot:4081191-Pyramimonas_sp.AAC.1